MKLVSLSRVKDFIQDSHVKYDSLLEFIIDLCSARIETFLNRKLEYGQRTIYFNAGKKKYWLNAFPIDMSSGYEPVVTLSDVVQTVDDDYFVWEDKGLIEFYQPTVYYQPKELKIVWYGGFDEINDSSDDQGVLDVPQDIQLAALLQSAFIFRRRADLGISYMQLPNGAYAMNKSVALLPEVEAILRAYRIIPTVSE